VVLSLPLFFLGALPVKLLIVINKIYSGHHDSNCSEKYLGRSPRFILDNYFVRSPRFILDVYLHPESKIYLGHLFIHYWLFWNYFSEHL